MGPNLPCPLSFLSTYLHTCLTTNQHLLSTNKVQCPARTADTTPSTGGRRKSWAPMAALAPGQRQLEILS